jgi:hypothetical protein
MTTEERLASCFQRIQELETSRAQIIECKAIQTNMLFLTPGTTPGDSAMRSLAALIIQQADAELIHIHNQQQALRRLAETFQRALDAFPGQEE